MEETNLQRSRELKLPTGILAIAESPDGDFVAGCLDGVYRIDSEWSSFEKLYQHDSYVSSVAYLGTNRIVSSGYDGAVIWYDVAARQQERRVKLHQFWSWDMSLSPDGATIASVTGQYRAGGYKYEPLAEQEPSVKIVDAASGSTLHRLSHVPSVQSVAVSHDGRHVAAGNLMGLVRVFEVSTGEQVSEFTTPDFTSWGIIKSHCYLGGIFAIRFTRQDDALLLAGMGPMRDPMAGNGRQLWQKWTWRDSPPRKVDETHEGESGEGLMEALAVHPNDRQFIMGGRLRGGDWNVGIFALESGNRIGSLKTGYRVTDLVYSANGKQLVVAGSNGQPKKRKGDGTFPAFGRMECYDLV